jgi:hypothetical protein
MDIMAILSNDERRIVFSSKEDRSIFTWNQSDTMQWWRPVIRSSQSDYPNGRFDENDWEEVGILTKSGHGPKTYDQARELAMAWFMNSLPYPSAV